MKDPIHTTESFRSLQDRFDRLRVYYLDVTARCTQIEKKWEEEQETNRKIREYCDSNGLKIPY